MPHINIRKLDDKQFQQLLSKPDAELNAEYGQMSCQEQQDFILRTLKESHVALGSTTLDYLKDVAGVINGYLWNGIRVHLTAAQIKNNAGQLTLALFSNLIAEMSAQGIYAGPPLDEKTINSAYGKAENLVVSAQMANQYNLKQIVGESPIVMDSSAAGQDQLFDEDLALALQMSSINHEENYVTDMFAYEVQVDPVSLLVLHNGEPQPIGPTLTEEIVSTGNLVKLKQFRKDNFKKLNDREKEFLNRLISSAGNVEKQRKEAMVQIAYGEKPPIGQELELQTDGKDGFIGFENLKLKEPQTSHNGCWSCAYSLLLRSRGVNLSQEDIRAFRADMGDTKASAGYRSRMNTDTVNNIFENGDLLMKVLPNTAMRQLTISPLADMPLILKQKNEPDRALKKDERELFEQYYIAQTREKLVKVIREALTTDKSPVAINCSNHYLTITGISKDGHRIRVEDSAVDKEGHATRILDLEDVIKQGVFGKVGAAKINATGLSLCWLKDIKPIEYGKVTEENSDLYEKPDTVRVEQDGTIRYNIEGKQNLSLSKNPAEGQIEGSSLTEFMYMDQQDMPGLMGGIVEGFGAVNTIMVGSEETYYPNKVFLMKDPALEKYKFNSNDKTISELRGLMESALYSLHFNQNIYISNEFKQYTDALDELNFEHQPDEKEAVNSALNTLKGLGKKFRSKYEDGRPYFQVLQEGLRVENRSRFRELWEKLDKSSNLGLNLEQLVYQSTNEKKFQNFEDAAVDEEPNSPYLHRLYDLWKKTEKLMDDPQNNADAIRNNLSLIIATEEKWTEVVESVQHKADKRFLYDPNEIEKGADEIRQSRAFAKLMNELKKGDRLQKLVENASSVQLVNLLWDAERAVGDRKVANFEGYALKEGNGNGGHNRLESIYTDIRNTRTGSYLGLGIISRRHNSAGFERAFEALRTLKNSGPGPDDAVKRYWACQDILAYLDGKEKEPVRGFGRKRWEGFMTALAEAMPAKEFEEYCNKVNSIRGVADKPGSDRYIGPENFIKEGVSLQDILNDTRARIDAGKGTDRDYARAAVLQNRINKNKGALTRTELRILTDRKLQNEIFLAEGLPNAKKQAGDVKKNSAGPAMKP